MVDDNNFCYFIVSGYINVLVDMVFLKFSVFCFFF